MTQFEMKKIFSKQINKIVLLVLAVIVVLGSFLTIRDVTYLVDENTKVSGRTAARYLREEKNKWKGELTEEVLEKVVKENARINDESPSADAGYVQKQGISDIQDMISCGFSEAGNYDYYRIDNLSPKEAAGLYQQRVARLREELSGSVAGKESNFSQKEKEFLIQKYESLETPLYYEYADGWKALLDSQYMPTLMIITIVLIGFLVSGIFSDEFQLQADSIFFSTRLGRSGAVHAKIKAGFLTITICYWAVMLLFSLIVLSVLGFEGAGCMVQTGSVNWESIYNITYFQDWLFTLTGGYIAHLFILMLAMFVSVKSRSTVMAVTIPFALSCAPMFLGRVSWLTSIMNFFPDILLRLNKFLDVYLVCEIGGRVFGLFPVLILLYFLLSVALAPALYYSYGRVEVK